ncbi:MAG: hypothetical protein KKE93_00090 [Nanoarchaeota archaeon]|nr:hypothetical protein [Nanoarchaeota archaeon]
MKNKKGLGIIGWLSVSWPIILIVAVFIGLIYLAYTQSPAEIPESDIGEDGQPTSEPLPGMDNKNSCENVTGLPFSSTSYLGNPGSNPEYLSGYSVCIDQRIDLDTDNGTWKSYEVEKGDKWCLELNMDSDHSEYIKCCAYCPQETHYSPISKSCKLDSNLEEGLQWELECPYITLSWDKDEKAISYEIIPFYDENKDKIEDGKCVEDIFNTKERYFYYNLESSGCAAYYTGNVRFQIIPQYSDSLSIESYITDWIDVSICNIGSTELTTICTDSDGGRDYYTKGTLTYEGVAREDVCIVEDVPGDHSVLLPADKCEGDNCFINEYVCEGPTFKKYNDFNCPNGCEDGACSCDMIDTLADGELKTYTINGIDYDVRPIITTNIYPYHVQFVVNGELTELLGTGNTFTLSNGAGITVIEILPNEAGDVTQDLVEFCLNGEN